MNAISYCLLILLLLLDSVSARADDSDENNESPEMVPNYHVINAPSDDPDMQWYVSDYFRRVEQWEIETTDYSKLQMGMYELTQYPNLPPSQAHIDAARKLIGDSFQVALRNGWLSKEKGLSDGFEKMYGDPVHYVNVEYVFDGETLNPEKPEVLMYYTANGSDFLMGVMFLAIGERGPQVAGPLSKWHFHIDRRMCYEQGVLPIGTIDETGSCEAGFTNVRSPEMLHLWYFDHPEGPFATTMGLTQEVLNFGIKQIRDLLNGE